MSAEIKSSNLPLSPIGYLQWGRAQMSAEIDSAGSLSQSPGYLQWGRAQMSAEISLLQERALCCVAPSMGPRSDERGNQYTVAADAAEGMSLQWGRAQMSAEIPFCSSKSATAMALQWGRAQMSAEINLRLPVETVAWLPFNGAALR